MGQTEITRHIWTTNQESLSDCHRLLSLYLKTTWAWHQEIFSTGCPQNSATAYNFIWSFTILLPPTNASCLIPDFLNHKPDFENAPPSTPSEMSLNKLAYRQERVNKMNNLLAQVLTHVSLGNFREGRELAKDTLPQMDPIGMNISFTLNKWNSRFRKSSLIPPNCQLVPGRELLPGSLFT